MKSVIQRVKNANVRVDDRVVGEIERGLVIYLGIIKGDTLEDVEYLAHKIVHFRIFPDHEYKMNLSLLDTYREALVISQFTLASDGKKGNRPSFDKAAFPQEAQYLYSKFIEKLNFLGIKTFQGVFGAYMQVFSVNDGPVTFVLET